MKIVIIAIILVVLIFLLLGYITFTVACYRRAGKVMSINTPSLEQYFEQLEAGKQWFLGMEPEKVEIVSHDGLRLRGLYLENPDAKGTIILMHGYRMDGYTDFTCVYKKFYDKGFSLLNAFQRTHAESEGEYITFGIKERYDCRDWAIYIADRFGPEHKIVLDGVSMGAATVLMASGLKLPENVKGLIADCGFTSPWDQLVYLMKTRYHLPVHPLLDFTDLFARLLAGFSLKECSTLDTMKVNTLPALFIHGEEDKFVPPFFTVRAFEACTAPKRLITVSKAVHGTSYLIDPETCNRELDAFLGNI